MYFTDANVTSYAMYPYQNVTDKDTFAKIDF